MNETGNGGEENGSMSSADAIRATLRFLNALLYRKRWVAMITIVVFSAGAFHYFTAPRIYEATTELLIDESQLRSTNGAMEAMNQRAKLPTYERLITCDAVMSAAIDRLQKDFPESLVDLENVSRDHWTLTLRKSTTARAARNTNIIELAYKSKESEAGKIVLSAIVDSFLELIRKHHQDNSVEALEILNTERQEVEKMLATNQKKLIELRTAVGAVSFDEKLSESHPQVMRALKVNENLTEVRKQRVELQSQMSVLLAAIRDGKDLREHLHSIDPESAQRLVSNSLGVDPQTMARLAAVQQQLLEDQAKLSTLMLHYGPTHPTIVELQTTIANSANFISDHQNQVNSQLSRIQNSTLGPMLTSLLGEKLSVLQAHEAALIEEYEKAESEVVAMNGGLAELMLVERNLTRLNTSYDALVDKIRTIDLGHSQADVRVSNVSEPKAGNWPVSPRLKIIVLSCGMMTVGLSFAMVFLLDTLDDRFRSPDELERQAGIPVMSVVRKLHQYDGVGIQRLQVHRAPRAANSEAFRTLRTALVIADPDRQMLAISSSEPSDGKTTVSSNLAASIAQSGKTVLIIDADLRKPGLTKLFELKQVPGLSQLLRTAGMPVREFIHATGIPGLDLIPCGAKPVDPAELLSSQEFADLCAWGTQHYDQVIVDCPPLLVANDAAIVSRITDGLIVVVQPQKNSRRLVLKALDRIRSLHGKPCGIVVNFASEGRDETYYGYGESYGYGYGYGYGQEHDDERKLEEDLVADAETEVETNVEQETVEVGAGSEKQPPQSSPAPGSSPSPRLPTSQPAFDKVRPTRRAA